MKILQLNVTANWGSTGKITEGIGLAAIRKGWESYIAYGRDHNPSQSKTIKVGNQFDVYKHYIQSKLFDSEGFGSRNSTKRLIKQIDKICPDIIHLHNIHDHWINYPILFKYFTSIKTPIVWTLHDCWAFTGGCPHFVSMSCYKWQKGCESCLLRKNRIDNSNRNFKYKNQLFNLSMDNLTIVSVSNWLDKFVTNSLLSNKHHTVIYNGVDTETFRPVEYSFLDEQLDITNKNIILGVSNVWDTGKGLSDYIELRKLLPSNYTIILVGLKSSIIKKLPKGIIGLRRTENVNQLVQLYSRANYIMSLSCAETFGMTLAEGLACGSPCIAYNASGTREVVSKDTGLLFQPGDIKAISDVLKTKPPFDSAVCRQRAIDLFNKDMSSPEKC